MADRHARQIRLAEVGEEGQARLERASAPITERGVAGETMARYLTAAGIGTLTVDDDTHEQAVRAMSDATGVVRGPVGAPAPDGDLDDLHPAARDVARGARGAVRVLRRVWLREEPKGS